MNAVEVETINIPVAERTHHAVVLGEQILDGTPGVWERAGERVFEPL